MSAATNIAAAPSASRLPAEVAERVGNRLLQPGGNEDDAEQEKVMRVAEEERPLRPLARRSRQHRVLQLLLV